MGLDHLIPESDLICGSEGIDNFRVHRIAERFIARKETIAVSGLFEHSTVLTDDGEADNFDTEGPELRKRAILGRIRQAAKADDVGGKDRRYFSSLGHSAPQALRNLAQVDAT